MATWSEDAKGYIAELMRRPGAEAPSDFQMFWWRAEPVVYLCLAIVIGIALVMLINRHRLAIAAALRTWLIAPVTRKSSRAGGRLKAWWLD